MYYVQHKNDFKSIITINIYYYLITNQLVIKMIKKHKN